MKSPPLVVRAGQLQQLQPGDDVELPLEARVEVLEFMLRMAVQSLIHNGLDVPDDLLLLMGD